MSLEELKEKVAELSENERLELISVIAQSIKKAKQDGDWQFLAPRPHRWRKQLYIKGSRLPASVIREDMIINGRTIEESADDWDLPVAAIHEAIRYCEENEELLKFEAEEEGRRITERGLELEPATAN